MDMNLNAESIEAWEHLKKLSDEERKRVLATVQSTLIQGMKLSPKELELLQDNTLGELTEEQSLEIIKNLIAQFLKKNEEEKLRIFLHKTIMGALPR